MNEQLIVGLFAAGGATLALRLLDWLLSRGKEAAAAQVAKATLDEKVAADLRTELRAENAQLRERLSHMDGQLNEMRQSNTAVLLENYKLTAENVRLREQVELLLATVERLEAKFGQGRKPDSGPLVGQ